MDRNKGYTENRKILRQYYVNDADAHKAVKTLAFALKEKITHPIVSKLMEYETVIKYLIDGYLAFEIIDENSLKELDPITLNYSFRHGKIIWIQFPSTADERVINNDKILYLTYYGDEMSFLGSVYSGLIKPDDKEFILSHVDFIVDRFSTKRLRIDEILNIDKILLRGLKISKLKWK